jgi:lipopolysaccharide transport system permease protein
MNRISVSPPVVPPVAAGAPPVRSGGARRAPMPHIRIEPSRGWVPIRFQELWEYRELIYFLCWRDIKARYKQTALGAAWAILQPVCAMIVFTVFFGRLAKMPSDGIPYPVFALAALVPWHVFANGLTQASTSLVTGSNLVTKVYFPRLAMPLAGVLSGIVDFVLAFGVLLALALYYGIAPSPRIVAVPAFLVLALITALGASLWLSALYVRYRDVRHVIPFLIQIWLFSTPVGYPSSLLSEPWRTVYGLNPMVAVVEGFRWALVGTATAPGPMIVVSCLGALGLLISGAFYFRRVEKIFADVV